MSGYGNEGDIVLICSPSHAVLDVFHHHHHDEIQAACERLESRQGEGRGGEGRAGSVKHLSSKLEYVSV